MIINGRLSSTYPAIYVIEPSPDPRCDLFMLRHALSGSVDKIVAGMTLRPLAELLCQHAVGHSFEEVYGPESKVIVQNWKIPGWTALCRV